MTARPSKKHDTVIFTGHLIDEPARAEPRFPPGAAEEGQYELIKEKLQEVQKDGRKVRVLASGAPGGDIICHRSLQRNEDREYRLPADAPGHLWQPSLWCRFRRLEISVFQSAGAACGAGLSDKAGLPNWLAAKSGVDAWERGNEWVLRMALSNLAKRPTLLALWNGQEEAGRSGGTGHSVRIARASGSIDVRIIDTKQLLAN